MRVFYIILLLLLIKSSFAQKQCKIPGDDKGKPGCPDSTQNCNEPKPDKSIPVLRAVDPNEIIGPTGYEKIVGSDTLKWVSAKQTLSYRILFENDPDFATAPAQNIRIELPIHPKLNPSSFRVGDFGFANMEFSIPENSAIYTRRLDVRDSLHVYVDVTAGIDVVNRKAFWIFQAIDPVTGLSTTVPANLGVLPVNDSLHRGEGFLTLTLLPVSSVVTRDTITAQASIVFDSEETIITNRWVNIVDAGAPTSTVSTVTAVDGNTARINWTGQDNTNGVGIDYYDLYVSKDNGAFQLYQSRINALTYDFKGSSGSNYNFFTLATDLVGNKEALKTSSNKSIFLGIAAPTITASTDTACINQTIILTATNCAGKITWSNGQTGSSISVTISNTTEFTANCTSGANASNESTPLQIVSGGAIPTATLSGSQTINSGQTAGLTLNFTGTSPWRFTINSETTSNITSSPYTYHVTPANTTTYTLTSVGNACGNFNVSTNNTATVTVNPAQSITTNTISGSPFCAGASVNVGYTSTGTFVSGNVFTAQLSNAAGSFASGTTNIGSITSTATTGTISTIIPANAIAGTAYRIRVIASNPAVSGIPNSTNLVIQLKPSATLSGGQTIQGGQSATLSATLTGASPWSIIVNGQTYPNISSSPYSIIVSPLNTTTYTLSSVSNVCGETSITSSNVATVTVSTTASCVPQVVWNKTLGGSGGDQVYSIITTADGGFLIGGSSDSNTSGDKTANSKGGFDFWVIKLNASGQKIWDKTYGSAGDDWLQSIVATSDGYLLGGYSDGGITGDKTEVLKGYRDMWLVKIDPDGTKQWDKTYGGSEGDYLHTILPVSDGFVLGGYSNSPVSGDKTENTRGQHDFWIVKVNNAGVKQWDKTIGGNGEDFLVSALPTNDGGYAFVGSSRSDISGEKSQAMTGNTTTDPFETDYWLVKTNASGVKQWDKSYGGTHSDYPVAAIKTSDGGFVIGGESSSDISGAKSEASKGNNDYWIIKVNSSGTKQWDKTIGGSSYDALGSIILNNDGSMYMVGSSSSGISGDKTENSKGQSDYWIVKMNANGGKIWDKTIGGNNADGSLSKVLSAKITDNSIALAGMSQSGISGDKTEASRGGVDYWAVKLEENCCLNNPDLIVENVEITKYTPEKIYYTARIRNKGLADVSMGSFFLGVYTSSDNIANSNDVWKYSITTGGGTLTPNQTLDFSYSSSFDFTNNQYYLRLKADELNLITECNKDNNNLFKLVNKCTTSGDLNITGTINSGYYATNKSVNISNASLQNNVLVVAKSIKGNPVLSALSSVFMIGGCLDVSNNFVSNSLTTEKSVKPIVEFGEDASITQVTYRLSEDNVINSYIWNATSQKQEAIIFTKQPTAKGTQNIDLSKINFQTGNKYILNIETQAGLFAKVLEF
jgi:hypothetical protein